MPKNITAITIKNAKAAEAGKRRELFDAQALGLCIRVSDKGHKAYVWRGRIKGQAQPIRITIGPVDRIDLSDARGLALKYAKQAHGPGDGEPGEDPRVALKAKEKTQAIASAAKFELVAEWYIAAEVAKMARPKAIEAIIKRYLVAAWEGRPIVTIKDDEVADVIRMIKEDGKTHTAILTLAYAKSLFKWASSLDQRRRTGLRSNPCAAITAETFKMTVEARQVSLSDDQIKIVWEAASTMEKPWGQFTRFLILSGQRRSEVSDMAWREVNFRDKIWVVPAERMKGKAGKRREHLVPLTPAMVEILEDLKASQPKGAEFVFSTMNGRKAVTSFSDAKTALDKKIAALVTKQEAEPLPDWRFHDLRRTVRTGFAKMETDVPASVAERVIAHKQSGIGAVYNVHDYASEKRRALTLWADRLAQIISPPPAGANVVQMRATP